MDIYVTNLAETIKEEDLKALFGGYGKTIAAKIIKDQLTGHSRGFAFVTMPDEKEALKAISSLHGFKIGQKAIGVSQAKPRTPTKHV